MVLIEEVVFTKASPAEMKVGLLGYVQCRYGDILLDGITVRRTQTGRLTLSFPSRVSKHKKHHGYVRPINNSARSNIEEQIFNAINKASS